MTKKAESAREALDQLLKMPLPDKDHELRDRLRGSDNYFETLGSVYFQNPTFQLTDEEAGTLTRGLGAGSPLAGLVTARHAAMRPGGRRYLICCMPKSGSSFLKVALETALQFQPVTLTSFGNTSVSSEFGMNSREQELDELALVKAALLMPQGYVAQHHTRYTTYLGLQMVAYGLTPIVTIRNIPDALVSFDDMMLAWRASIDNRTWTGDTPFAIPMNYPSLAPAARIRLIAQSLGVWLIQFHLSWRRAARQGLFTPLVIRYEDDILDPERLVARLSGELGLDKGETERLRAFAERPDRERARLNVGKAGRGRERVPDDVRAFLTSYARVFAGEIPAEDIAYLAG